MVNDSWKNPWKLTAIGMALVIGTVLVTGLVVANWSGKNSDQKVVDVSPAPTAPSVAASSTAAPATPRMAASSTAPAAPAASGVPTQSSISGCNQSAASQAGQRENTKDTVISGAIGAVAGAAVGAAGGAVIDGGSGAGKGAIVGGLVGAGGGTLYGLNENHKHDERYRNAYAACMRSRGYTS